MSAKSLAGINAFPHWVPQEVLKPFSQARMLIENQNHLSQAGDLAVQTWLSHGQGKFLDDDLQETLDNGTDILLCLQGQFPWQADGEADIKKWPVDWELTQEERKDPDNYPFSGIIGEQLAIRYSNDCTKEYAEQNAANYQFPDKPEGFYANNLFKYALGTVRGAQGPSKEYDFKWGDKTPETPEVAAAGGFAFYRGVRKASQTMEVLLPPNVGMESDGGKLGIPSLRRLAKRFDELSGGEHTNAYLSAHLYPREGEEMPDDVPNQENGVKISGHGRALNPEQFAVGYLQDLTDICTEYGLDGFYITEIGVGTRPDGVSFKQVVQDMEGYTLEQAQVLWWKRFLLIAQTFPMCKGVHFWNCRDNYDGGQHRYSGIWSGTGWNDAQPKEGWQMLFDLPEEEYPELWLGLGNGAHAVLDKSESKGFVWSAERTTDPTYGDIGPNPKFWEAETVEPPTEPEEPSTLELLKMASEQMVAEAEETSYQGYYQNLAILDLQRSIVNYTMHLSHEEEGDN